jgi:hypothetical protein
MKGPTNEDARGGQRGGGNVEAELRPLERLLARLDGVCSSGAGWKCLCPAHEDRHASLSIAEGRDGRALVYCHAGCSVEAVCQSVGLKVSDLFPACSRRQNRPLPRKTKSFIAASVARRLL